MKDFNMLSMLPLTLLLLVGSTVSHSINTNGATEVTRSCSAPTKTDYLLSIDETYKANYDASCKYADEYVAFMRDHKNRAFKKTIETIENHAQLATHFFGSNTALISNILFPSAPFFFPKCWVFAYCIHCLLLSVDL